MKNVKKYGISLLFSLFSSFTFANEIAVQEAQTVQVDNIAVEQVAPAVISMTGSKTAPQVVQKTVVANINQVNINTASAAEIQDKLVGIGAKKAQAIVDYREKNGQFMSVEQLTEVSGIGKATLDRNRDRILVQ